MKQSAGRLVAIGQVTFLVSLLVCLALRPSYLRSEGGVSNYGTLRLTVAFYSLAFIAASLSSGVAGYQLRRQQKNRLVWSMYVLAALFGLVLLSTYPYKLNGFFRDLHELTGGGLFVFELLFSAWLCLGKARSRLNISLLAVFLVGFGISFMTTIGLVHLLFVGQIITAVAFAALLVNSLGKSVSSKTLLEN